MKAKRGRGRPKGSKNKTTATTNDNTPKRGRGRPKGSKNKTTATINDDTPKRGRGRPKGSKNKTTATTNEDTPKRGRGRPKGSKNKTETLNPKRVQKSTRIPSNSTQKTRANNLKARHADKFNSEKGSPAI